MIESRPLSRHIGAEVLGIDLAHDIPAQTLKEIIRLWEESSVLLFRNQHLDDEQHVRFVENFGELQNAVFKPETGAYSKHPAVVFISNVRVDGKLIGAAPDGELMFHSDYAYRAVTGKASCLYSIEVPSKGGETVFASCYAAYEHAPAELLNRIEGLNAVNAYSLDGKPAEDAQRHIHPLIRTHPGTGRKVIFANRLMTTEIVGLPKKESDSLLEEIFALQEREEFRYTHHWSPRELVIWDNRSCLHARMDFDASERRLLRRVSTRNAA